jgi:hypothetical protein
MSKLRTAAILVGALIAPAVQAATVGVPVNPSNFTTTVGSVNNGTIDFYIPINPTHQEVYGVSGGGLSSDQCSSSCGGGSLTMYLNFGILAAGHYTISLQFTDLDLTGYNDPTGFFETLSVSTGAGPAPVWTAKPFQVVASQTDLVTQVLEAGLDLNSSTFFVAKLVMNSLTDLKYLENTPEALYAKIYPSPVPLPAAAPLLASALAGAFGFNFLRSRRRRAAAARA